MAYRFKNFVPSHRIVTFFLQLKFSCNVKNQWQGRNVSVNIDDIGDFTGMTEEDYRNYPPVTHPILGRHPITNTGLAYVGSIHAQVANSVNQQNSRNNTIFQFRPQKMGETEKYAISLV